MTVGQSFDDTASRKLEAVYQTPDVIAQRHRTLTALEAREGEHILDVGAGPGLLIADMAAVVGPRGHVTGLEISDSMLAVAHRRFASSAIADRVTLVKGDAAALPFPDASFDAATSTQVYEYVPDVDQALAELYRVLRSGGRALILDTDWASIVWNTTDQPRMADFVTGRPDLTPDEVQAWQRDLAQLGDEGRYFFSLNRYLFLADKPLHGLTRSISGSKR
jgi:SAM-dependent methyltransferase